MQRLVFHFDVVSPYAWLAFDALPQALEGCSYWVDHEPVLFAGLLQRHAHKGPAEIAPKRDWTYRHVAWLARRQGTPLRMPATHPFNPLPLLRLALACVPAGGHPNRRVVEALFRHVWDADGADPLDAGRLAELTAALAPARDPAGAEVKDELRARTEAAGAAGVFGVPTFDVAGRRFWGQDALPMVGDALRGDPWLTGPAWDEAAAPRPGVARPGKP